MAADQAASAEAQRAAADQAAAAEAQRVAAEQAAAAAQAEAARLAQEAAQAAAAAAQEPAADSVYYENCAAVRAAGAAPILRGEPGYSTKLDRDRDGVGCEN